MRFPVILQNSIVSLIAALLSHCGPATIAGFIVPVVVNPVEGCSRGLLAHVGKEVSEVMPPLADCNSASTVVSDCNLIRLTAPIHHACPCGVYVRTPIVSCVPMRCIYGTCNFTGIASAGERAARVLSQRSSLYCPFCPAIAETKPVSLAVADSGKTNYGPATEPLSRQINSLLRMNSIASARRRPIENETSVYDCPLNATVAAAFPVMENIASVSDDMGVFQYDPQSETLARKIATFARHCNCSCNERIAVVKTAGRTVAMTAFGNEPSPTLKNCTLSV